MKCKMKNWANNPFLLILGIALVLAGLAFYKVMDATGLAARMAGFVSGIGGSFATIWIVLWGRKRFMSREAYEDAQREMADERGQMVNFRAAAVQNCCAVAGIVVMTMVAVWEGNELFMTLGTCSCFVIAIGGAIARWWYNRNL